MRPQPSSSRRRTGSGWNEALRRLDALQQEHDKQRLSDEGLLNKQSRECILALARNFAAVWNDPQIEPRERKRMLALLIEDVTLIKGDPISAHVRFRGGRTTSLTVEGPKPIALVRKFKPQLICELNQLLDTYTDQQIADRFNALGYRNRQQQPFTRKKVISIRTTYKLKSRFRRLRERGLLTAAELARRFGVSTPTIQHWGNEGLLPRQHCDGRGFFLYEPVKPLRIDRSGLGGRMTPIFTRFRPSRQEIV
jgi:DNA-binding transcriptional regulator YiaG